MGDIKHFAKLFEITNKMNRKDREEFLMEKILQLLPCNILPYYPTLDVDISSINLREMYMDKLHKEFGGDVVDNFVIENNLMEVFSVEFYGVAVAWKSLKMEGKKEEMKEFLIQKIRHFIGVVLPKNRSYKSIIKMYLQTLGDEFGDEVRDAFILTDKNLVKMMGEAKCWWEEK